MRIIEVVPSLDVGGAERVASLLAVELARAGHDVVVVSLADPVGSWIQAELSAAGVAMRFLGKRPGLDLSVLPRLRRVFAELRPEIIHTHLHVLKYAMLANWSAGRASVVHTLHNLAQQESDRLGRGWQQIAFRVGVAPVAIGQAVAQSVQRVYGLSARATIPNGIRVDDFATRPDDRAQVRVELGIAEETPTFLVVGRLDTQKNHAALINAFAAPSLAALDAHLLIAGDGELRAGLVARADALGLGQRVRFLGVRADVPRLLGAADAFALASRWEGNPLVVMEALAAGLPVVATAVGCVPELVTPKTGRLVPTGDLPALIAALHAFAADLPAARRAGDAAASWARAHFDVAVMASSYAGLFAALRHPPKPGAHPC
ncbi:MAG: glycosyltransferase [Oligoflexia bacterium]|nr:glycosyltransferase [Oligoflexia bacterium]